MKLSDLNPCTWWSIGALALGRRVSVCRCRLFKMGVVTSFFRLCELPEQLGWPCLYRFGHFAFLESVADSLLPCREHFLQRLPVFLPCRECFLQQYSASATAVPATSRLLLVADLRTFCRLPHQLSWWGWSEVIFNLVMDLDLLRQLKVQPFLNPWSPGTWLQSWLVLIFFLLQKGAKERVLAADVSP